MYQFSSKSERVGYGGVRLDMVCNIAYHVLRLVLILCVAWCLDADGFVGGGNAARAVVSLIQGAVVDPRGDRGYS